MKNLLGSMFDATKGRYMTSFVLIVALLSFSMLLSGCITKTVFITQTKYEVVRLPGDMLKKCPTTPPPDRAKYMAGTDEEKENTLASYNVELIGDVASCNKQIAAIKAKEEENVALTEKRNKDLKPDGK